MTGVRMPGSESPAMCNAVKDADFPHLKDYNTRLSAAATLHSNFWLSSPLPCPISAFLLTRPRGLRPKLFGLKFLHVPQSTRPISFGPIRTLAVLGFVSFRAATRFIFSIFVCFAVLVAISKGSPGGS